MEQPTRDSTSEGKNTEKDNSSGLTDQNLMGTSRIIILKDTVSTRGPMAGSMWVSGRTTRWRVKGRLPGQMGGCMLGSI